jgi:hypothetical protein
MLKPLPRNKREFLNLTQGRLIELLQNAYKAGREDLSSGIENSNKHVEPVIIEYFGEVVDMVEFDNAHDELDRQNG